ncbi:hypothetical protein [Arthrobacter sp. QXT-31]|uniref:hypothetical protein n=1 Tax=Arthrobacter sp. QXT-31 TaxID=1357915 RepID=UPI0009719C8C|nr:hypothetical protein [Arthrobacter sp. QXT-31]APX00381.1 hypothetical protein BWQ92_00300 [Arthrobacter sp. QXT-31]
MTVAVAFKSTRPADVAAYLAARETEVAEFHARTDAFKEELGGKELFGTAFFDGGWAVRGFHTANSFEEFPAGWRRESRFNAVPAKRTPEGKEAAATLATLRLPGNKYPGATEVFYADGFMIIPRMAKVGDDYYLTLSKPLAAENNNTPDPEFWEPVKLSAYHAALEASGEAVTS